MKYTITLAPLILLAACLSPNTPNQLIEAGPGSTYLSNKESGTVAKCIAKKWEEATRYGAPIVNFRETETGHRVTLHALNDLRYVADIDNIITGSRTKLYIGRVSSYGTNAQIKDVSECQ